MRFKAYNNIMKTSILILLADAPEGLQTLKARFGALTGDRFNIEAIATLSELKSQLRKCHQAIVINHLAPPALNTLIGECQQVLPVTSFISVLDNPGEFTNDMWNSNSQFIAAQADDFTWAAALSTAGLQSSLQTQILPPNPMDEVSNLLSRPFFMQRLSESLSESRRHGTSICCVIFSINFYPLYLDSYGYQFVNALLGFVAREINQRIRHEDQLARLGDSELALLIRHCSEADTKMLIQRLTRALNALTFEFEGHTEAISTCAGMIAYPFTDDTPITADIMIRYAHHALHQSKNNETDEQPVTLFSEIRPTL